MKLLKEKISSASLVELSASALFVCCAVLCAVMIVKVVML